MRRALPQARLLVVTLALACAEGAPPAYTRVDGPVPPEVGAGAGAWLVVFWATWCPPCREELPSLLALARDPPAALRVVTFGEDPDEEPVREHFRGAPPAALGYRPDPEQRVARAFGVDALPAAFLVRDGRLVARFTGGHDWSSRAMRRLLTRLASGPAPRAPGAGLVDAPRGGG